MPYLQNISKNLYFVKETKIFQNEKCPLMSFKGYLPHKDKRCARLKCPYDQIFDIHFFTFSYTVGLPWISCQISIYFEV